MKKQPKIDFSAFADVPEGEYVFYATMRVANAPTPSVDSIQGECHKCKEPVWVARNYATAVLTHAKVRIICEVCMSGLLEDKESKEDKPL